VDGDVVAIELVSSPPSAAELALDAVLTAQQLTLQVQYISLVVYLEPELYSFYTQHECFGDYCAVLVPRVRTQRDVPELRCCVPRIDIVCINS
jgi:hypothetical protein